MGTQGWAIAGFLLLVLVVIANYLRETARATAARAAATPPAAAPTGPRCSVLDCPEKPTKARHGWELCTPHYDEFVEAPAPRVRA